MREIEHGCELPEGFTPFQRASLVMDYGEGMLEVPLSPAQLHMALLALGIEIDAERVRMLDDDELREAEKELAPDWVSVPKAAEMLGLTKARVYSIIRAGGLETRDDMGPSIMVSVASIKERLANPPKAGRRW